MAQCSALFSPTMELNAFVTHCVRHCVAYFEAARDAATGGILVDSSGSSVEPFYPSILLVFETPTHFGAELVGGIPRPPTELQVIRRELPSLGALLGMFPTDTSCFVWRYAEGLGGFEVWSGTIPLAGSAEIC